MYGLPVWLWGLLGGLALGPIGLLILWPACSRGASALLQRFVATVLIKLVLAGIGLWVGLRILDMTPYPLVFGFFAGYFVSLIVEILLCLQRVRKCA
ncbi:MAG: hypothetical protein C4524_00360 [Candidatus Zixiibacteriota bacterium]|nr:MAG: hypothetical protein C4524_00360 [candidate division Zixibacteria bacterium]